MRYRPCLAALLIAASATFVRAGLPQKPTLNLDVAKKIAARAETEAAKRNWTMVIVVLDDGGNVILLERMDGTQLGSLEVAEGKARTALRFKRPSKAFEDAVAGGRNAILSLPGVVAIEGGMPLMVDGVPVGAVGVSGMKSNEDGVVAQAAVAEFNELTK
ncbi:MAG TPA: heme-binding protein [Opitutaceae bacterium]|nr:heme-binding protein [Opitutaceae bacterium]